MIIPKVVDWRLTYVCNQRCPFCYGPEKEAELDTGEALNIINLLAKLGVEAIVITGGEPLLRKDLPIIIKAIKDHDLKVYVSTNGDFYMKRREEIEEYLDALILPIDGYSATTHDQLRANGNFERVTEILASISSQQARLRINVGTVVCRENMNELNMIERMLSKYQIHLWKVYQFIPYTDRKLQKKWNEWSLGINEEQFQIVVCNLGEYLPRDRILVSLRQDRNRAYFMINPGGNVVLPIDSDVGYKDVILGNLVRNDVAGILTEWEHAVELVNYVANAQKTFSHSFGLGGGF